jgi:tellurite resistance protein
MTDVSFASRVFQATTQGAVAAVVAASLSAVTEPIVNKVLVERIALSEALKALDPKSIVSYFGVTVSTNLTKFPFFEITNLILTDVKDLSPTARGALTGAVFCTMTLPITNYRYVFPTTFIF